jgi:NAD(P)-dependent dehydrogenase (short-subunit alcohol dehydrogenase family)
MVNNSKKKIAVVTGSSKGIGKAIALAFAKSGDYSGVVINSRKLDEAQQVSEEINNTFVDDCDTILIPFLLIPSVKSGFIKKRYQ